MRARRHVQSLKASVVRWSGALTTLVPWPRSFHPLSSACRADAATTAGVPPRGYRGRRKSVSNRVEGSPIRHGRRVTPGAVETTKPAHYRTGRSPRAAREDPRPGVPRWRATSDVPTKASTACSGCFATESPSPGDSKAAAPRTCAPNSAVAGTHTMDVRARWGQHRAICDGQTSRIVGGAGEPGSRNRSSVALWRPLVFPAGSLLIWSA